MSFIATIWEHYGWMTAMLSKRLVDKSCGHIKSELCVFLKAQSNTLKCLRQSHTCCRAWTPPGACAYPVNQHKLELSSIQELPQMGEPAGLQAATYSDCVKLENRRSASKCWSQCEKLKLHCWLDLVRHELIMHLLMKWADYKAFNKSIMIQRRINISECIAQTNLIKIVFMGQFVKWIQKVSVNKFAWYFKYSNFAFLL